MSRALHHIIILILSVLTILVVNVGFLFFLIGFLPSVMAYFGDTSETKDLYKTVRAANIAGVLPVVAEMTKSPYPGASLQIVMGDPHIWMQVYGAAIGGWALIHICRWVSYFMMLATAESRRKTLIETQKALVEEWGEEIAR